MNKQYDHKKVTPLKPKPNLAENTVSVSRSNDGTMTINVNGKIISAVDPAAFNKLKAEVSRMRDDITSLRQAIRVLSKR